MHCLRIFLTENYSRSHDDYLDHVTIRTFMQYPIKDKIEADFYLLNRINATLGCL